MAKKKADEGDEAPKSGGGGGLVGFILVTLLAAGAGAGFGVFLYGSMQEPAQADKKAAKKKKEGPKTKPLDNSQLVTLIPVVAQLPDSGNTWLRLEASVVLTADAGSPSVIAAEVAADVAAYLKSTPLVYLEGASGYVNLRQDLVDRARIRAPGKVKDLVIHGVIIE